MASTERSDDSIPTISAGRLPYDHYTKFNTNSHPSTIEEYRIRARPKVVPSFAVPSMPEALAPRDKEDFVNRLSNWEIELILAPFKSGVLLNDSLLTIRDAVTDMDLIIEAFQFVRMLEQSNAISRGGVQLSAPSGRAGGLPFSSNELNKRISKPHLRQMLEPVKREILSRDSVYSVRDMESGMDFAVSVDTLIRMTDTGSTAYTATGYEIVSLDNFTVKVDNQEAKREEKSLFWSKRKVAVIVIVSLILLLAAVVSIFLAIGLSKGNGPDKQFSNQTSSSTSKTSTEVVSSTTKVNIDSKILVIGGFFFNGSEYYHWAGALNTMELFHPFNAKLSPVVNVTMMHKRSGHTSAMMDDGTVVTVGGGVDGIYVPDTYLSSCERYNPSTGNTTQCPSLNTGRTYLASSVLNGVLHVCGGTDENSTSLSTCLYLDANAWKESVSMNTERNMLSMESVNGYLYAIGGSNANGSLTSVERCSATDEHWSYVKSMKLSRGMHASAVINAKIYVCGGEMSMTDNEGYFYLSRCERFDPLGNQWTEIARMHVTRWGFALEAVGKYLFAMGDYFEPDGAGDYADSVEMLDSTNDYNTWTMMEYKLVAGRWRHTSVLIQ